MRTKSIWAHSTNGNPSEARIYFKYCLYLYRRSERQRSHANGRSCVTTFLTKHFNEQIGSTVNNAGVIPKIRRSVDIREMGFGDLCVMPEEE